MFGKKKEEIKVATTPAVTPVKEEPKFTPATVTTIANGVTLVGDFQTNDPIEILGSIRGNIQSTTMVHVAKTGSLEGNTVAENISIDGNLDGDCIIRNTTSISDTGVMTGSLKTKKFFTTDGSYFDGRLSMIPEKVNVYTETEEE